MQKKRVFISSVQSEFAEERQMLFDYLTSDALLGKFFEPFVFENVPAMTTMPTTIFLQEVERCDIYIGLFGEKYGFEDSEGISSTEREYDYATKRGKTRFVFLKEVSGERHLKEQKLIQKVQQSVVRKSFDVPELLKSAVYATLIRYLEDNEIIRTTPFDATFNPRATFVDLSEEKIRTFVGIAQRKRSFPFTENSDVRAVLTHLNLIDGERITNAALLLFGNTPQRFFITSEVRCAHFHGLDKVKPIPSYQVYKGDVFEMIEQAVDFVLSKINLYVGDRSKSVTVDVEYEIPKQAVTEAIVNAVAHRDYTSNGSVQVMLFADRFEVSNPANFPHELTIEQLYTTHRSMPANPLIAEAMYLRGTIERMGTGTEEMTKQCVAKGLGKPTFDPNFGFQTIIKRENVLTSLSSTQVTGQVAGQVAGQVTGQVDEKVIKLLKIIDNHHLSLKEMMVRMSLSGRDNFLNEYLTPAIKQGFVAMKYPQTPKHPKQQYSLTQKGKEKIEILK
ncbi:MAG: DUF4062 domain-containing protein [Bacteroidales bacterium]|jgi:hypothetical protein|nr:DUF4062 domain-containing protein [Bacteroidales bacterium]